MSELERAYFAQETVKRKHISKSEVAFCKEAVRSAHSTKDCTDNKTVHREGGTTLFKSVKEVGTGDCRKSYKHP